MPVQTDAELERIFEFDTIAVVGCSTSPGKAAHDVPKYMQSQGFQVVPVNPFADEVLGERAYGSLDEVDRDIDVVDVFRPSEEVPAIVDDVLERDDVQALWLQLGIADDDAAARAEDAGLAVVQNKCIKVEHSRLRG